MQNERIINNNYIYTIKKQKNETKNHMLSYQSRRRAGECVFKEKQPAARPEEDAEKCS